MTQTIILVARDDMLLERITCSSDRLAVAMADIDGRHTGVRVYVDGIPVNRRLRRALAKEGRARCRM